MTWHSFIEVLKNGILVTGLVMVMMMAIEYINVRSAGRWFKSLQKSKIKQVFLGALLGLFPGCAGGFASVSLYSHGLISIGALVAAMIASSGDEAFVMLAMIPKEAALIFGILFVIAIVVGLIVDKFSKKPMNIACDQEFEVHEEHCHSHKETSNNKESIGSNSLKKKIFITAGLLLFGLALIFGLLEHAHECHDHHHHAEGISLLNERWINILLGAISLGLVFLTIKSSNHFVDEHIWNHVIKKHFLSIFLWTFGALLVIELGMQHLHIHEWIADNLFWVIVLAALIGIIPESGPHMVFVSLFAAGAVPLSVLLVSSISQDGHTALPLLASDKKGFIKTKIINFFVALAVGCVAMLF